MRPSKWQPIKTDKKGLRWHFENVYLPIRLQNSSPTTVSHYRLTLSRFDNYLGHAAMLDDLKDENITGLEAWLEKTHGLSVDSVVKDRDNLTALWRLLYHRRIVDNETSLQKRRPPKRVPIAWTPEQLKRLWDYVSRMPGEIDGVPANIWFQSLHAVIWDTGERIGAVMKTEWKDVDLDGGWIIIRAEVRKGRIEDKLSKLHPDTIALLRLAAHPERERVWPWPYHYTYLFSIYRDMRDRAGLPTGKQYGFHTLRKSVASYVKAAGGNATDVLGHSDPRVTAVYIDPRVCPKPHAVDFLPRMHEMGAKSNG